MKLNRASADEVKAKDVQRAGSTCDFRATIFSWDCGRCDKAGEPVDDFMSNSRLRTCLHCCAENLIVMHGGQA